MVEESKGEIVQTHGWLSKTIIIYELKKFVQNNELVEPGFQE